MPPKISTPRPKKTFEDTLGKKPVQTSVFQQAQAYDATHSEGKRICEGARMDDGATVASSYRKGRRCQLPLTGVAGSQFSSGVYGNQRRVGGVSAPIVLAKRGQALSLTKEMVLAVLRSAAVGSIAGQVATIIEDYNPDFLETSESQNNVLIAIVAAFGVNLSVTTIQAIIKAVEGADKKENAYDRFCYIWNAIMNVFQISVAEMSVAGFANQLIEDPELNTAVQITIGIFVALDLLQNIYLIARDPRKKDQRSCAEAIMRGVDKIIANCTGPVFELCEAILVGAAVGVYLSYAAESQSNNPNTVLDVGPPAVITGAAIGGVIGLLTASGKTAAQLPNTAREYLWEVGFNARSFLDALLRDGTATLAGMFAYHTLTQQEEGNLAALIPSMVIAGLISYEAFAHSLTMQAIKRLFGVQVGERGVEMQVAASSSLRQQLLPPDEEEARQVHQPDF